MYLKKIEIKGFKSFPDKTEILFPQGLISVVGPNGSGKSNILDAIRWVLGEQSMKSLRGEKLEDVIFSGTQKRKEMNYCEVSLLIDNKDKKIDIDYSEIDIKRKAFKSGESQFFINNKQCRLKDIKELLLDTGIGREGYSIISQGKIDELVEGNAFHRRKVIEEAAGISKYRYRKEESQKKLENTRENLERINDVYFEIEKQVKPLEEQKIKAERYLVLREQLILSDVNRLLKELDAIESKKIQNEDSQLIIKEKIAEVEIEKNNVEERKQKNSASIEALALHIKSMEEESKFIEEKIYGADRTKAVTTERKENLLQRWQQIELTKSKQQSELEELEKVCSDKEKQVRQLNSELERVEEQYLKQSDDYQQIKDQLDLLENKLEHNKSMILESMNEQSSFQSKKDFLVQGIEKNKTQFDSLEEESRQLKSQIEYFEKNIQQSRDQIVELEIARDENQKSTANLEKKIEEEKVERKKLYQEIAMVEDQEKELLTRSQVLKKMDQEMEGISKGVKELMKNSSISGIIDVVANVVKVKRGYEKAMEAAMGGNLQNLIVEDAESAKSCINYLKKNKLGRVTFFPLDTIKGKVMEYQEQGILAIEAIEYPKRVENIIRYILGRIVIVEDMQQAIRISRKFDHRFKIVTLDGEIFNAGGSITGGSIFSGASIFTRRRTIEDYENTIRALKQKKQILDTQAKERERQRETDQERLEDQLAQRLVLTNTYQEIKEKLSGFLLEKKHRQETADRISSQVNSLEKQKIKDEQDIQDFDNKIISYEEKLNRLKEEVRQIIGYKERDRRKAESQSQEIKTHEIEKTKILEMIHSANREGNIAQRNLEKIKNEVLELRQEEEKLKNLENQLIQEVKDISEKILQLESQKIAINQQMLQKQEEKSPIVKEIQDMERDLKKLEELENQNKTAIIKIESEIERYEYQRQMIGERLIEEYQMEIEEAEKIRNQSVDTTKKTIEETKMKISEIGNVNLDSIEEYKRIKERYDIYREQKLDLEQSMVKIEELIRSLEKSMKSEFAISFREINEKFKEVFSILFGGGQGELVLVDEANLLGSDIDISVQPPGKKVRSISVLSGGEKALSAIAILFAILMRKPVPFCVLDEIDAPLDDANIYRFVGLLNQLTQNTQFLTITHRRGTMESSDYIYGVTMQENGVSKIVNLKLEEAESYVEN